MTTRKSETMKYLEKLTGGPLTFGDMIANLRETDDISQAALAEMVGMTRQNLNDIEKGRTGISPAMAVKFAKAMGYPEQLFLSKAIEADLRKSGLKYEVHLEATA